eukprot:8759600-Pyramimonas_sp.AAC.1
MRLHGTAKVEARVKKTHACLQGALGFLGSDGCCHGKRDGPTPKIDGGPGVSGLGFLWKVSCGRDPTIGVSAAIDS